MKSFQITPLKPVEQLRREALASQPPTEPDNLLPPDLVQLDRLDPTIKLDIRYAGSRNFLGAPLYLESRAYMQRPAAEAVARASHYLHTLGYGLLIHDSYRPWYVTKMFWEGTPPDKRIFVADPAQGSRHNRGCAVDLTLYNLGTGEAIVSTGGYVEMSERSYPFYPGGTAPPAILSATFCARPWKPRVSPCMNSSGGTSTTRTGADTPFSTSPSSNWRAAPNPKVQLPAATRRSISPFHLQSLRAPLDEGCERQLECALLTLNGKAILSDQMHFVGAIHPQTPVSLDDLDRT